MTKIGLNNSLYPHRHFIKHLVDMFGKPQRESNLNHKTWESFNLVIQEVYQFLSAMIHTQLGNMKQKIGGTNQVTPKNCWTENLIAPETKCRKELHQAVSSDADCGLGSEARNNRGDSRQNPKGHTQEGTRTPAAKQTRQNSWPDVARRNIEQERIRVR
jgi:hypothetical protein